MKTVLALRSKVKTIIDTASELTMINGRHLLCSPKLPPMITGRVESTQGARMVSTPANSDGIRNSISFEKSTIS